MKLVSNKLQLLTLFLGYSVSAGVQNASFESDGGWDTPGAHVSFTPDGTTQAYEGSKVAFTGGWRNGTYLTQSTELTIQPGGEYVLSAYYAPRGFDGSIYAGSWLRIVADAGERGRHTVASAKDPLGSNDWMKKELRWQSPSDLGRVPTLHGLNGQPTGQFVDLSGATLEILVGQANAGSPGDQTYIDKVELTGPGIAPSNDIPEKAKTPSPLPASFSTESIGDHAIANAGFETTGTWNHKNAHEMYAPDGMTMAKEGRSVGFVGGWGGSGSMTLDQVTDVAVQASGNYRLSAWFAPRLDGESEYGGAWLRLMANGPTGRHTVALLRSTKPITEWTEYQLDWVAPDDLARTPTLNGLTGAPTGKTADITGAKLEILVGRDPDGGDPYKQTYIDAVRLQGPGGNASAPKLNPPSLTMKSDEVERIFGPIPENGEVEKLEDLNVVWDRPGYYSRDSMPLGNGETALNVWTEPDGQIAFDIARTDAWSGLGRLLKVGRVRIHITPNPFLGEFRQTLDLETATVKIEGSEGFEALVWVDANHQSVIVQTESDTSFEVRAETELLRPETRPLESAEAHSAYSMAGGPAELMVVEADTLVEDAEEEVIWYHRNGFSVWPTHMINQGLESVMERLGPDPLLDRTFGALMRGKDLVPVETGILKTRRPMHQTTLEIFTHTAITESAEDWIAAVEKQAAETPSPATARRAHDDWWAAFWNRSWIYANGEKPDFLPAYVIFTGAMRINPVIGASQVGKDNFEGAMDRLVYFERPISDEQVEALYESGRGKIEGLETWTPHHAWYFGEIENNTIPNRGNLRNSSTALQASGTLDEKDGALEFRDGSLTAAGRNGILGELYRMGGAVDVWIKPEPGSDGGYLFDQRNARLQEGVSFQTFGPEGLSLRAFRHDLGVETGPVLVPDEWNHVVVRFDAFHGQLDILVNGAKVAGRNLMEAHIEDAAPGLFHLSQGYALQRFITACAGRGNFPIKFNGSLFTMDGPTDYLGGTIQHDSDFRMWGPDYWFQNTRLPYWPMIQSGDFDLLQPYWNFYWNLLDVAKTKTEVYYGHEGAYFPETITFWGTFNMQNYGWPEQRAGQWRKLAPPEKVEVGLSKNAHIRYYFDGMLEFITMMLDYYAVTLDETFLNERILPFSDEIVTFYEQHYGLDDKGDLFFYPSQAMESYQFWAHKVENPANVIGGLRSILPRLMVLTPESDEETFELWDRVYEKLPPLPIDTERGVIKVSSNWDRKAIRGNGEEPGLYNVFPYQNYSVGRPDLDIALNTLEEVYPLYTGGWNQDAVFAAMLGQTEAASALTYRSLSIWDEGTRFPAFWGPNYDWVPDQDHGGTAVNALQRLLLLSVDEAIHLFPAWPQEWDVDFKLHANYQTTVRAILKDGELVTLEVTPESRTKDVVLPDWLGGERATPRNTSVKFPSGPGMPDPGPLEATPLSSKSTSSEPLPIDPAEPMRLFFSESELPAIRARLESGQAAELMEMLRGVADNYLSVETNPYDSDGPYIGRNLQAHIGTLALVGWVDDEPRYLEKAKEILLAAVDQYDVDDYHKANTHLAVGDGAVALAIAYDWLGPILSEKERLTVAQEIQSLGFYLYNASTNGPHPFREAHNHSVVAHNGLFFAGEITQNQMWIDYAIPWIAAFMTHTQDGSGAPYEGLGYVEYGLQHGILPAEVLRRVHGRDLFQEIEGLDLLQDYVVHHLYPWGGGTVPINQTGSAVPGLSSVYYVINRLQDQAGMYAWLDLLGEKGIEGLADVGHPSHFRMYPFLPLWTNNDIHPASPLDTDEPLSASFKRGMVSARTAWEDPDAALFTFSSARQVIGIWDHPDENTFTLSAFGDSLIVDPGPHVWENDSHGIILIDGTGYTYVSPGHRSQGTLEVFEDRGNSVYVVGDAADAYRLNSHEQPTGLPVERAERRILFVRAEQPFLVVVDAITLNDGKPHQFTWQANYSFSEFPNTIELDEDRALITGARNGTLAAINFLEPEDLRLSTRLSEGQHGMKGGVLSALSPQTEMGEFLTLVTVGKKENQLPSISHQGDRILLNFPNGESWRVKISDSDITAALL